MGAEGLTNTWCKQGFREEGEEGQLMHDDLAPVLHMSLTFLLSSIQDKAVV